MFLSVAGSGCQHESLYRELRRDRPFGRLRIWTTPDAPNGSAGTLIVIEYAGLIFNPSSYGLLGGKFVEGETRIDVPVDGRAFVDSLAADDHAAYGLPAEYQPAVVAAVPSGLAVTLAAHGRASSSQFVFGTLSRLLMTFLGEGIPDGDVDIWLAHDEAAAATRARAARPG